MTYLVDTNIISELARPTNIANAGVVRWAKRISLNQMYLSAITIEELEIGVRRKERANPDQVSRLRAWFTHLRHEFQGRILAFGVEEAMVAAALHDTRTRPVNDARIAATAKTHGLILVTHNVRDFTDMGLPVVDPWMTPDSVTR